MASRQAATASAGRPARTRAAASPAGPRGSPAPLAMTRRNVAIASSCWRLAEQPAICQDGEADIVAVEADRLAMGLDGPIPVTDPLRAALPPCNGTRRASHAARGQIVALALQIPPVPDHRAELGLCVLQPTRVR